MTPVLFITWPFASQAETPAIHGAALAEPRQAVVRAEGGFAGPFPTVLAGVTTGLGERADIGVHAVTHAGLAYALGVTGRYAIAEQAAIGLMVDESLFTVDELGGIDAANAPFGHRLAVTPSVSGRWTTDRGLDLGATVATGVALVGAGPGVETAWAEVAATWPGERGRTFVRVRAIVPVAGDFHPLGYIPWIAVGRTWGLQ